MNAIEPGTPVIATITGTVGARKRSNPHWYQVHTERGEVWIDDRDAAMQVVPVDPERPTLEQVLAAHVYRQGISSVTIPSCTCGAPFPAQVEKDADGLMTFGPHAVVRHRVHLAEQLRAAGVAL